MAMSTGAPSESSVFDDRSIDDIYREIQEVYRRFPQPWVIGYSGGKDSTCVVQLVWKAIERLPVEERKKPVFVIASDTKVETPVISDYIDATLAAINEVSRASLLPFEAHKVVPRLNDTFWVNLIGRGYPAPTTRFRWCTDRMKIGPVNRFIEEKVTQYGEVVMVLGIRKTESATRMQLMNSYEVKGHVLRRHGSLRGAYVYAPIADFSVDDVWTYLLSVASPWKGDNADLARLYRNASAGECPLVIDTSTPPCGNSRFGCWVCTVAQRDTSMESLIESGEAWMEPLLEFRDLLADTTNPERKYEFRDIKGRDGQVRLKKDGTLAARTYKLATSRDMLRRLLRMQLAIRSHGPYTNMELITEDELHEIRRIWRTERQDWEDSVPKIFRQVNGYDLNWVIDDNDQFDASQKALLEGICDQHKVPFDLVARLLEEERRAYGLARRSGIQKGLARVLGEEWRSQEELQRTLPGLPRK